ncbi:hypothetical protein LA080_002400 [Diaporthe eres]|nr:hypothetical protein LA080_002400 [Diaporthe eres]
MKTATWVLPGAWDASDIVSIVGLAGTTSAIFASDTADLLQQSSAAFSTAQAVQKEVPAYSIRPQTSRMMLGPGGVSATEHQVEFLPSPGNPGYADVMGGPDKLGHAFVPIDEAERLKINHERRTSSLELIEEMPPTREVYRKLWRAPRSVARYRCSNCWTWYCSKACQRRSWASHVFVCRVSGRPNDVDFLRWVIRRVKKEFETGGEERIYNAMLYLLADDHICRTFGFSNCESRLEVLNLVCLYSTILPTIGSAMKVLQQHLEEGTLGELMERFCQMEREVARVTSTDECACVTWFLQRLSSGSFLIPNMEEDSYDLWILAFAEATETLNLTQRLQSKQWLKRPQADCFHLYVAIQPSLWLVPDVHSSSWVNFGFCYCRSFPQRAKLARRYLALASSPATFDDIVSAYETESLADLMHTHGIDISDLERHGIRLHRPHRDATLGESQEILLKENVAQNGPHLLTLGEANSKFQVPSR